MAAPPPNPAPRSPFEWGPDRARVQEPLGAAFQLRFRAIERPDDRVASAEAAWGDAFSQRRYGPDAKALVEVSTAPRREAFAGRLHRIPIRRSSRLDLGICAPRDYWATGWSMRDLARSAEAFGPFH